MKLVKPSLDIGLFTDAIGRVEPFWRDTLGIPFDHRLELTRIGVRMAVRNLSAHRRFFSESLGLPITGNNSIQAGTSVILLEEDPKAAIDQPYFARGWRYLTMQIDDVRAAYAQFLAAGGSPGMPIRQLRDVARAAMVRDIDGNWIELSQRASLCGPLGPPLPSEEGPLDVSWSKTDATRSEP